MKIWRSFSSDHSAKLRIVGTFKTAEDAQSAAKLFNALLAVEDKGKGGNPYFSDELMKVCSEHSFHNLDEHDPETLDLFYEMEPDGNSIVVETDDTCIQVILKVFINRGGRIEMYSRHDYVA